MSNNYLIYKHTSPSGQAYIGQTNNLHRRNICHINTNGCRAFANAIKKYGWDNFTHEILAEGLSIEEANNLEEEFIKSYGTLSPNGYNLRTGGGNSSFSDETRAKLSEAGKRRTMPEHLKIRLSELGKALPKERMDKLQEGAKRAQEKLKGKPHFNLGRQRSDEFKRKVSEATKAALSTPEARKKMSESRIGNRHSAETKAKQSEAAKKRWEAQKIAGTNKWTEEARISYMKAKANGISEETRKKISQNSKLAWEKRRAAGLCDVDDEIKKARHEKQKEYRAAWARADRAKKRIEREALKNAG
jgi:group I intron endonuclease